MSITCQAVVNRALSKIGIIEAGGTPTSADNALALDALQQIYRKLITSGAFGALTDVVPATVSYDANENERIMRDSTVTTTVNLPVTVPLQMMSDDYGLVTYVTDPGLVRPPRDLAVIEDVDTHTSTVKNYIYDGRLRQWIEIGALTATSTAPLAHRDMNGLACMLAMNLVDEFGQQISDVMAKAAFQFEEGLTHNWSQAGELIQPPSLNGGFY